MAPKGLLALSVIVAALVGIAQFLLVTSFYAYSPVPNLLLQFTLDIGARGSAFFALNRGASFAINVLMTLPAAFILLKLRPRLIWLYLVVATVPMFVWESRLVFFGELDPRVSLAVFVPGWLMELAMFPVATYLVATLLRKRRSLRNRAIA